MRISRIALRNIRSYPDADIELAEGTTLVTGDVGSGKTSLLYGVEMALFGFAEVEPAFLVRHGSREAEVRLTLVDDEHRHELVRKFLRRSRKGRDVFELKENSYARDGARTLYSATELRQRAIDLLGFPDNPNPRAHSDLWRWAVYIPQERMRDVLQQDPGERLETVRKALGVEQYRAAAENAQEVARELKSRAENADARAEGLEHWKNELARATVLLDERQGALVVAAQTLTERRAEVEGLRSESETLEKERREGEADRRELARLQEELGRLEREATARAHEIDERERRRAELEVEIPLLSTQVATLSERERELIALREERRGRAEELRALAEQRRTLAAAEATLVARRAAEGTARESLERATSGWRAAETELAELSAVGPLHEPPEPTPRTLEEISAEIAETQHQIDAARDESTTASHEAHELLELERLGVCPRCHQAVAVADASQHREEAEHALAAAQRRVLELTDRRDRLGEERSSRERYERNRERWDQQVLRRRSAAERESRGRAEREDAAEKLARATSERTLAERAIEELAPVLARHREAESLLERLDREVNQLAQELQELVATRERMISLEREQGAVASDLVRLRATEAESIERRAAIGESIRDRSGRVARLTDVERRSAETGRRLEAARAGAEAARAAAARIETEIQGAEHRIRESQAAERERSRLRAEAGHLRLLANWLARPFHDRVLTLEHQLLARAHDEFDRQFARFFATLIEDPALVARCDAAFAPEVEIEGEWTPPEALSGGERTALALAYRLALGQLVRSAGRLRLKTLILDEPTDGFSPEQVARMGELLEEIGVPQVILVSHEAQLAGVADRVIRIRKENGVSSVSPAEGEFPRGVEDRGRVPARRRNRAPMIEESAPPITPDAARR